MVGNLPSLASLGFRYSGDGNIFYLSSKDRKAMLEQSHLRHVYIHSDRVTMFPYGQEKPKNGGTKMYAWAVWDKEYNGKPTLSWI